MADRVRTYTFLDLRLGQVPLTEESREAIRKQFVPILVRLALRNLRGSADGSPSCRE